MWSQSRDSESNDSLHSDSYDSERELNYEGRNRYHVIDEIEEGSSKDASPFNPFRTQLHRRIKNSEVTNSILEENNIIDMDASRKKGVSFIINDKGIESDENAKNDLEAIKEGLAFALGDSNTEAKWFPISENNDAASYMASEEYKPVSYEDGKLDFENYVENYSDNIPLVELHHTADSESIGISGTRSIASNNLKSNNPFIKVDSSPDDLLSRGDEIATLESGPTVHKPLLSPLVSNNPFSNAFTRLTDRIVGSRPAPSPTFLEPKSSMKRHSHFSDSEYSTNLEIPDDFTVHENLNKNLSSSPGLKNDMSRSKSNSLISVDSSDEGAFAQTTKSQTSRRASTLDSQAKLAAISASPLKTSFSFEKQERNYYNKGASMYLFGNSLKIFSPESRFRQLCYYIVSHKWVNSWLLTMLFLQTSLLAYRQWNPIKMDGYFYKGYNWADYILMLINFFYSLEIFFSIIAYGFYDDRVMFEELKVPYPENAILQSALNYRSTIKRIKNLMNKISIHTLGRMLNSQKVHTDSTENEVALNEVEYDKVSVYSDSMKNIRHKYGHGKLFDEDAISEGPSYDKLETSKYQYLSSEDTIAKPKVQANRLSDLALKRAYIRSSWNRIDFVSTICFWISVLLSVNHYDAKHDIMLFRALSCLRILRLCNLTAGTSTILTACKVSIPQLIDVAIFISCFWVFFAIIGIQSFKSSFRRNCVWYNPDDASDVFINTSQYCGSFTDIDGSVKPYIKADGSYSLFPKGFRCPKYSRCESRENPYGGTVSFDNVLQSMELVFVIMSANTFTDLMYDMMDSDTLAASLYFICCIFVMTVWLINVFIAVIVDSFNATRTRISNSSKAEKQSPNSRWNIFNFDESNYMKHQEKIQALKKNNKFMKWYYKVEFVFPIIIVADMFSACFHRYDMSQSRERILHSVEQTVTLILLIEIIVRLLIYYPHYRLFFSIRRNAFDLFLAVVTFVIVLDPIKKSLGNAYGWLTVFQLLRFYRVVLATKITSDLWLKIMSNFRAILDLALFYFILTFLSSIILARYFEGTFTEQDIDFSEFPLPMHTLPNAFVALYVITSTENWTEVLYGVQEYAKSNSSRAFGAMFLIGWFIISNMVILNMFISVIAHTLEVSEDEKRKKQLYQFIESMTRTLQSSETESSLLSKIKFRLLGRKKAKEELEQTLINLLLSGTAVNEFLDSQELEEDDNTDFQVLHSNAWMRWFQVNYRWIASNFKNPFYQRNTKKNIKITNFDPANFAKDVIAEKNKIIAEQNDFLRKNPKYNYVFYFMGPRHRLRNICQLFVKSSHGDRIDGVEANRIISELFVILMFIASVVLVVEACYVTPLYMIGSLHPKSTKDWNIRMDVAFLSLFTSEFLVKIIADGLVFTPNAYMRSSWNIIDLTVLISMWIEIIAYLKADQNLSRLFRGIKALRALRLLTISNTAKNNFHDTIIAGFWKIMNAAIISLCFLFPFSIWALNIFSGRLGYCVDGESSKQACFNEYSNQVFNWNVLSPNVYTNQLLQFDSFGDSFSSLFQIVSLEGWLDLLINVMSSTGIGTPTSYYATPINGFFVILFNFTSIVFILTTFVSVIISNYSRTKGTAYMTSDQIAWYQVKRFLLQVKPSRRKNVAELSRLRKFCYKMTVDRNKYWSLGMNFALFLNVIASLIDYYPSIQIVFTIHNTLYMVIATFFTVNAFMLLIAQGPRTFVSNSWNIFSLIISTAAFITTIIAFSMSQENLFVNFNRLLLLSVLLFIIPRSDRLSELLRFASASIGSLISLLYTWLIVFLVYAIAMNQIFGTTKIGPNTSGNINLRTVPKAMILLFRCSFGEGWNYIMDDFRVEKPFCTEEKSANSDCGNKQYAYILFMSWNIISMYIFLNMFISLIINGFNYINYRSAYSHLIKREEIRKYKRAWQKFDPEGTGYIDQDDLPKFLHSLTGALSYHIYHGDFNIPNLCRLWIKRNDPMDPYNIELNYDIIEKVLNTIDIHKMRERRKSYERFIEEAILTSELNGDPGISFKRILIQLPLYNFFEPGQCLNLIDFLDRRLLMQNVEKSVHTKRVHETIAAYACRWTYKKNNSRGVFDTNIDFGKQISRKNRYKSDDQRPKDFEENDDSNFDLNNHGYFVNINNKIPHDDQERQHNEETEEGAANKSYVPRSPLNIFKSKFGGGSTAPKYTSKVPQLKIHIPDLKPEASNLNERDEIKDTENIKPLENRSALELPSANEETSSFIELSLNSATLEDSEWENVVRNSKK